MTHAFWADSPDHGSGAAAQPSDQDFRAAVTQITEALADALAEAADESEARRLIYSGVRAWVQAHSINASLDDLAQAVFDERFGLGAIQPLIDDPEVENIDINGCDQVWVTYAGGHTKAGPPVAATDEELISRVQIWARQGQTPRQFSTAQPLLNTALPQAGGVRLTATMSVTPRPSLSIRCHRLVDVTLADLQDRGTIDAALAQFLTAGVRAHKNLLISGGLNGGKTTLLRGMTAAIDPDERIATIESDRELMLDEITHRHRNVVAFEARRANSEGAGEIPLTDLIPQALRHNVSRVIVGEVRDKEIVAMLQAMNLGHDGSMSTIHAHSADQVFTRILSLARQSSLDFPADTIHLMVGELIDFIVHMRRDKKTNQRYVTEVLEVLPPGDGVRPATNRIFRPDGPGGRAVPATAPQCLADLAEQGLDAAIFDRPTGFWGEV